MSISLKKNKNSLTFSLYKRLFSTSTAYKKKKSKTDTDTESLNDDYSSARSFLSSLSLQLVKSIPHHLSYARSSGPGGQNVNKLNTKASLRIPLPSLLARIPAPLHPPFNPSSTSTSTSSSPSASPSLLSRFYSPRSHSLIIQADSSRSQSANVDACFEKLLQLIRDVGKETVPGKTSEEQRGRVKKLKSKENEERLKRKKMVSAKKKGRGKQGLED